VRTLGIDLASQPKSTGACVIDWRDGDAVAEIAPAPLDDAALVRLAAGADLVAIDAPFGWPDQFVAAVSAYHQGFGWPTTDLLSLRYRLTDLHVAHVTGVRPLSVSSDLIAVCAYRAARLLTALRAIAPDVPVVEVYPAGALRAWKMPATGYKGVAGVAVRGQLVDELVRRCAWLSCDVAQLLRRDHDLDALLSALVGRAIATGRTQAPSGEQADAASREGWIHLPTCPPEELVSLG
jgi:predicted nuclease with RNAse H fold